MIMMVNRTIGHLGAIFLGAGLLATPALGEGADPTSTERAILVLDASGSMWGQVDGAHKITIARDVIRDLLADWNPKVHLGLTAYGHREKGNCADIETLTPVGPMDSSGITAAVDSLNPKGKTPLTEAVRQAAEALRYTEERATVILVSDGKETCGADPCAVAKELEADGIEFTTHVVGFDLTDEEKTQLQCIADNTGGKFLSADSAPALHEAMATTVQLVAAPETPEPDPEPALTGLRLSAVLAEGGEPLEKDVYYDVYKAKQDVEGKREHVVSKTTGAVLFDLPPEKYFVTAQYTNSNAVTTSEVEVTPGSLTEVSFVLNAGHLRLATILDESGEPLEKEAYYEIYKAKQDVEGERDYVTGMTTGTALFRLAAGDYFVTAQYASSNAVASTEVSVKPGELTEAKLNVNAGHLRLAATLDESGEPLEKDAYYQIYKAKQDIEGEREHVTGMTTGTALFKLAAGDYFVTAQYASSNAVANTEVSVKPGELTEAKLNVNAGHLRLTTVLDEGEKPLEKDVYYEVYKAKQDIDGKREHVNSLASGNALFKLAADRYFITAAYRPSQGNAFATAELDVKPGEVTDYTLQLKAGYLKLATTEDEDGERLDAKLTYEVFESEQDVEGKRELVVLRQDAVPRFSLNEGKYVVRVTYDGGEVVEAEIDVPAGAVTEHKFVLNAND